MLGKNILKKAKYPYFFLTGWGIFWILTYFIIVTGNYKAWGVTWDSKAVSSSALASNSGITPEFEREIRSKFSRSEAARFIRQLRGELDTRFRGAAGLAPARVLTLGDFDDSLRFQKLSLERIESLSGRKITDVPLSSFGLSRGLDIESLLRAVPGIGKLPLGRVPLLIDLMGAAGIEPGRSLREPVGKLLERYGEARMLSLSRLNLEKYTIKNIPFLSRTALERFPGWREAKIAEIPGLSSVPLEKLSSGTVARVDMILGDREKPSRMTVSGGRNVGFRVPCPRECAHIELGGAPEVAGRQWIGGRYQKVDGGHGFLKGMFGGLEPTGRHWMTDKFKVVLWDVDEKTDTVSLAFFFRVCKPYLGCSPYGIGPFRAFTVGRGDRILLGDKL